MSPLKSYLGAKENGHILSDIVKLVAERKTKKKDNAKKQFRCCKSTALRNFKDYASDHNTVCNRCDLTQIVGGGSFLDQADNHFMNYF